MNVLIVIGIIIGIAFLKEMIDWIDDATRSSRWERERKREAERRRQENIERDRQYERERQNKIDKAIKGSNHYYHKYKNSANTMEIISVLKTSMPNPPYGWGCQLYKYGIPFCYSFSEHGYKNLSSDEQVYGLARAIAYNLGNGFETTINYNYDHGIEIHVKYKFTKPLKEF